MAHRIASRKSRKFRQGLMGGALVAGCLLTPNSVSAQSSSDAEKLEQLQRQTELLQKQLDRQNALIRELQQEVSRTRKKSEKKETEVAKRSEPSVNSNEKRQTELALRSVPPVNSEEERPRPAPSQAEILRGNAPAVPVTLPQFAGVNFQVWGWLEAATGTATIIRSTTC
jgi:hypothetical protein